MSTEFLMPKLGLTMEEGKIIEWLVDDGVLVEAGTAVLRIETDKVESDVESPAPGRLLRAGLVGETYRCGSVIGQLLNEGETAPERTDTASTVSTASNASAKRSFVSPNAHRIAATLGVDPASIPGTGPSGRVVSEDVEEFAHTRPASPPRFDAPMPTKASETVATAAARQLAELLGIDLSGVTSSAADGRISREDVARHVRARLASVSAPSAPIAVPLTSASQERAEIRPMTAMRSTIARRMHGALNEMAQLTLTMEAPCEALVEHRRACTGKVVPGITDYVLAATARSLRSHPIVNSQMVENGIALLPDVHLGMAVAVEGGLVVPVIRHADRLSLTEIAVESSRLAMAARNSSLAFGDMEGGTMSVTALGMFGVEAFTPVINPPNAAILGVGRIRPIATSMKTSKKSGKKAVTFVESMTLSLTWDHRILDGAPAAEFCRHIVELLQDPAGLDRSP